jgi:hypothetical protein
MYNHSLSLKEFVEPLPICQPETDLGNILSIFQHSNCKMLAISQGKLDWGVINAEDLLSLVAEVWLNDYPSGMQSDYPSDTLRDRKGYARREASAKAHRSAYPLGERNRLSVTSQDSQPKNFMYQQSSSCRLIPDVKTLIKPAMVYQADTKLDTFLSQLKYGSLLTKERVCLIVNRQGELQGKLDQDKIIEYLASKPLAVENVQLTSSLHYLTTLLEAIALPSKIETIEGQVIYTNQLWRQLIIENQNIVAPKSPSVYSEVELDEMTKWLIDRQRVSLPPHPQEDNQASASQPNCTQELEKKLEVLEDSLSIQLSQVSSWNYLKIPLTSDRQAYPKDSRQVYTHSSATRSESFRASSKGNRQQIATGEPHKKDNLTYNLNLILAIPQIQSHSSTTNEPIYTSQASSNQLLATVSHELKSPLTGIIGLTSLLQGQKLGNLNQRQTRYAELIYRSSKKMMSVVDDLLQLTALTADRPRDSESINLETLCHQLYQEVLTKANSMEGRLNSSSDLAQPQLSIEPGSEMALANKLLLSSVLSHLMLEALVIGEAIEPLKIQIKSLPELMTIVITGQTISATSNPGLNLMIAECLSELLEAQVTHSCSTTSCQFTLLLPQKNTQFPPLEDAIAPEFTPKRKTANLTILCLYPELEVIDPQVTHNHSSNFDLKSWLNNYEAQTGYQHRIIEADSLEQAHNLARIWRLDAIILNGYQIAQPSLYLRSLQESEHLARLPLITLDTKTTEAANQIEGLNVYPCLLPAQQCNIADLIQVIKIAIES